jgi:hypothetical protein
VVDARPGVYSVVIRPTSIMQARLFRITVPFHF